MGSLANNIMVVGAVLAALVAGGSCGPPKVPPGPNITTNYNGKWLTARATWYGQPNGAGAPDNGGACGIKKVIAKDVIPANWRPDAVYTSNVQFY
ncbi:Expansin-B4 [Zea mays]|uniref:Expansin-B4 n=1 Tax=Zea mays TaxID=4577 RepID=A0A1D6P7C4_MAIZE|nr:Expansin-B4 [Zea mays]